MIITVIGDCDTRPVLYTLMKICQSLGDVLLVTSNNRMMRLSDTRDNFGHYQNTMIGLTLGGIDDFWQDCIYDVNDFNYVIIDNLIAAEADLVIYCRGLIESEEEKSNLEFTDDYVTIDLFTGTLTDKSTLFNCEEFEACRDMCPINSKLAAKVCKEIAEYFNMSADNLLKIATVPTSTHPKAVPAKKKSKSKKLFGKGGH